MGFHWFEQRPKPHCLLRFSTKSELSTNTYNLHRTNHSRIIQCPTKSSLNDEAMRLSCSLYKSAKHRIGGIFSHFTPWRSHCWFVQCYQRRKSTKFIMLQIELKQKKSGDFFSCFFLLLLHFNLLVVKCFRDIKYSIFKSF